MEKLKLWLERSYPYTVAFIVTCVMKNYFFGVDDLSTFENFGQALSGNLTISGLIIGFLGAVMPVIISMRNDSQLVRFIFEKDTNQLFLKYTKQTLFIGLFNVSLTIFMFFLKELPNKDIKNLISLVWVFLVFLFLMLTYRSMSCMLKVIFIKDSH